jgi:hypothetical protein
LKIEAFVFKEPPYADFRPNYGYVPAADVFEVGDNVYVYREDCCGWFEGFVVYVEGRLVKCFCPTSESDEAAGFEVVSPMIYVVHRANEPETEQRSSIFTNKCSDEHKADEAVEIQCETCIHHNNAVYGNDHKTVCHSHHRYGLPVVCCPLYTPIENSDTVEKPSCFGVDYDPSSSVCRVCASRVSCCEKYVNS